MADQQTVSVKAGDVIRTPAGETHGLQNAGLAAFIYLTATTPLIDLVASI